MATYGIDYYAGSTYGQKSFLDFDANPFFARPYLYGVIRLEWMTPTGNWSRLRLVRSSYGFPVQEEDGLILFDINSGPTATGVTNPGVTNFDDLDLTQGAFYYYTLFVLATDVDGAGGSEWRRAGDAIGLSPKNHRYTERMLDRIPSVYTTSAQETGGHSDESTVLQRFLSIFGFDLDFVRTQYETLRDLYNPDKVSGGLLPILAEQFGLAYEPEIGVRQTRILLRNLLTIRKRKGTLLALEALASSFTNWGTEAFLGHNLLLDYDDSSFEDSLGKWRAESGCTISRRLGDNVLFAYSAPDFVNKQLSMLEAACTGGTASVRLLQGGRNPVTFGVPVIGGLVYGASTFLRSGQVTTRGSNIAIEWYDQRGALISVSRGADTVNAPNDWSARAKVEARSPLNAVYASLELQVVGAAAGEKHLFDAVQLELSGRLLNGGFEYGTVGYTNGGLANHDTTTTDKFSGASAGRITVTTAAGSDLHSWSFWQNLDGVAVDSRLHVARVRLRGPAGRKGYIRAIRRDAAGTSLYGTFDFTRTITLTGQWQYAEVTLPAHTESGGVELRAGFRAEGLVVGDVLLVDDFMIDPLAADPLDYPAPRLFQEARDVRVELRADRVNEVPNPSAEIGTLLWSAGPNSALARSTLFAFSGTEAQLAPANFQTASFAVTASAGGDTSMLSDPIPVLPNAPYTLTSYAHSPGDRFFRTEIVWLDSGGAELGTSIGAQQGTNGEKWFRGFVTSISPLLTVSARVRLVAVGCAASEVVYFDAVLLEKDIRQRTYFDASTNQQRLSDYLWEGGFDEGRHRSRSHYYFNRTTKNLRLGQLARDHLAPGTTFSLLFAQPGLS